MTIDVRFGAECEPLLLEISDLPDSRWASGACKAIGDLSSSESQNLLQHTDLCASAQGSVGVEHTPKKVDTIWLAVSRPCAAFAAGPDPQS